MLFNSISFVIFFPIVVMAYFLMPVKMRMGWLLITSYFYYMCQGPVYALLLLCSTLITYTAGLLLGRFNTDISAKKLTIFSAVLLNLGLLFYFKYFNFFMDNIGIDPGFRVVLPVGISFYVFQAIGYIADVYRGKIAPEKNPVRYALFVSFFPQILAGPIGRAPELLPQFDAIHTFDYDRVRHGMLRMLWGYFLKLVIASRLSIAVELIFNNYSSCSGWQLFLGASAYSFQIYCDFASYSILALGAAEILGFRLTENFRQPFFAMSLAELWRRWHISLMNWFRDYVYIPLGGSRKGTIRKHLNTLIVFTLSGLWHGAAWTYVLWGFLSGVLQVIGTLTKPARLSVISRFPLNFRAVHHIHVFLQQVITFLLFTFTVVFFKASDIPTALGVLRGIFTDFHLSDILSRQIFQIGLGTKNLLIVLAMLAVLFIVDTINEKTGDAAAVLFRQKWFIRWGTYYFFVIMILSSANIGAAQFIYFNF